MKVLGRLRLMAALAGACAPVALLAPQAAQAQFSVGVSITANIAPPPLPYYIQPPIPGPNFIWTPGYWAWDDDEGDYYWVPGSWVEAPEPGLLWTPGYWGWANDVYVFHPGYWGPHVGFYGGVVYGFGYTGFGYQGGYWQGGSFFYNRTVNHITNVNITNVYNQNVSVTRNTTNNVSFNGGPGGVQARPTPQQMAFAHEPHVAATPMQRQHQQMAASTPGQFAKANGGRPAIAATPRATSFQGPGVMHAQGARPFPGGQGGYRPNPGGPRFPGGQGGYRPNPGGPMLPGGQGGARPEEFNPGGPERPEGSGFNPGGPDRPDGRGYNPGGPERPDGSGFNPGGPMRPADPNFNPGGPERPERFARPPQAPRPQAPRPQAMRPPPRPHPAPPPRPHPAPHPDEHH